MKLRKTLLAPAAAGLFVLGQAAPAYAGQDTNYIETTDSRHGGGAIFRADGDALTVCDQAGDGRGVLGQVWVERNDAWHFWYGVKDPAYVGDNACSMEVARYGEAAVDYNGRESRNIPEGARVSIDVSLYWGNASHRYMNEDEGVA
jgi:hypothetical protein